MLYSPKATAALAPPPSSASAARKMVSTVPAMEIQKRFESESMDRTSASAGIDSGLMPA